MSYGQYEPQDVKLPEMDIEEIIENFPFIEQEIRDMDQFYSGQWYQILYQGPWMVCQAWFPCGTRKVLSFPTKDIMIKHFESQLEDHPRDGMRWVTYRILHHGKEVDIKENFEMMFEEPDGNGKPMR